jgi:hypothetical protein
MFIVVPCFDHGANIEFGSASPTASMSLSDFDLNITGDSASDEFGRDAVGVDFDGDGFGDLVITAPASDANGTDSGSAYLFYGPLTGSALSASDADLVLEGGTGDAVGAAVDAGDYDGDGDVDIAVSTTGYDSETGGVFIWATEGW